MTKRYFGTYYLVVPNWEGDPDHPEESVVKVLRHGRSHLDVAMELWRLADNETRAAKIKELLDRAHERDNSALNTEEVKELLQLLDGLEDALKASVVESDWTVAPDRLPELRRRTRLIDIDEDRGATAIYGVSEAMSRVSELHEFLKEALDRGLHVALN